MSTANCSPCGPRQPRHMSDARHQKALRCHHSNNWKKYHAPRTVAYWSGACTSLALDLKSSPDTNPPLAAPRPWLQHMRFSHLKTIAVTLPGSGSLLRLGSLPSCLPGPSNELGELGNHHVHLVAVALEQFLARQIVKELLGLSPFILMESFGAWWLISC